MRIMLSAYASVLFAFSLVVATQANARLIGQSSELSMGRNAARQIERRYKVSNDATLTGIVKEMGARLAKVSSRPSIEWTFKVLDAKEVNAFSVPGFVYVNRGLMEFVNNDRDELASVIAHEIGHTCGRHAANQAEKSMMGGVLISLLFKRNAQNTASFFTNLAMLGYSRKDEYQADKFGVDYAYAAGFDPEGMIRFFTLLQAKEKHSPSKLETYFRTHPPTKDRIKRAQAEIAKVKGEAAAPAPVPAPTPTSAPAPSPVH